ncbi:DNA-binding protein [Schistosoma japonicum]|uniref:DNA-binding protein n=1 Tax=Schistosoma japonicum TaxID=6182 RepID=A0A4Z2D3F0_SCHJA|nr:DNA-binding protein [Schistosoma japonicum]
MDNLSNYHSPNDLDKQMENDDIAWMDALDVSGLGIDDTSQIFSTVNSFKFISEEMNKFEYYSVNDKLKQNSIFNEVELNNTNNNDDNNNNNNNNNNNSNKELTQYTLTLNNEEKDSEHNSDSTLTCSEAEYYNNLLKQKRLRKHRLLKRKSKLYKSTNELSSNTSSYDEYEVEIESKRKNDNDDDGDADSDDVDSDDDDEDDVDDDDRTHRTIYHSISNLNKCNKSYSSQSTIEINENESWWPNPVTRRMHKDFHSTLWLTNTSLDNDSNNKINTMDYYYESDSQQSNSSLNEMKIKRRHHHHRRRRHHKIKLRNGKFSPSIINNHSYYSVKRKSKQMELWQFILCHLETYKDSAFQWVNRSTGLFRIVNTQLAAKEWGYYRNNKLMDYEKMARAMRFYYKDSILRKSRQQLHFQFAMPYVKWAEKFYRNKQ